MKNSHEKNLTLFKELRDKNMTYFFIDNLMNKSLDIKKYNQKNSFYDTYFGIFLIKKSKLEKIIL